jgi:hypothetical protein
MTSDKRQRNAVADQVAADQVAADQVAAVEKVAADQVAVDQVAAEKVAAVRLLPLLKVMEKDCLLQLILAENLKRVQTKELLKVDQEKPQLICIMVMARVAGRILALVICRFLLVCAGRQVARSNNNLLMAEILLRKKIFLHL